MLALKTHFHNFSNTIKTLFQVRTWLVLSIIIPFVLGLVAWFTYTSSIDNFLYYRQLVNTIIAGILGLLLVVTMFYLGKTHDYHKDLIKISSEIEYSTLVCTDILNNLSLKIISLKEKTQKYSENKIQSINDHLVIMTEHVDTLTNDLDETSKSFIDSKDITVDFSRLGKNNFKSFIVFSAYFAMIFFILNIASNSTYGSLLYFLALLVSGILVLLFSWYLNEQLMDTAHRYYVILLSFNTRFNYHIFNLKYFTDEVKNIDEKISEYIENKYN